VEPTAVQFLLTLAMTLLQCGRAREAAILLSAVAIAQPAHAETLRLLALAQLQSDQSEDCLRTLDQIRKLRFDTDKQRQMTWIRIRALHRMGRRTESKQLIDQLRHEVDQATFELPLGRK
jgi:hypothetical protein